MPWALRALRGLQLELLPLGDRGEIRMIEDAATFCSYFLDHDLTWLHPSRTFVLKLSRFKVGGHLRRARMARAFLPTFVSNTPRQVLRCGVGEYNTLLQLDCLPRYFVASQLLQYSVAGVQH
jgi:hypothetical protein